MKKIFRRDEEEKEREEAAERVFNRPGKSISDILPAKKNNVVSFVEEEEGVVPEETEAVEEKPTRIGGFFRRKKKDVAEPEVKAEAEKESVEEAEEEEAPKVPVTARSRRKAASMIAEEPPSVYNQPVESESSGGPSWIKVVSIAILLGVVALAAYASFFILPRADIKITLKKTAWEYNNDISALVDGGDIAAQLFTQNKNLQVPFPATGKKFQQTKAQGSLKIVNAFSSDAQPLVASTRFVTPDGKIFRLVNSVTVPGAQVQGGKITPSSIDAAVIADQAGPDYNVGPVTKWTIPGFKGSPKYDAFYGVSAAPMTGGAIGNLAYPTDDDIQKAKVAAEQQIKDALTSAFSLQVPSDFKVLDSGSNFVITKEAPLPGTDADGKFKYYIEAKDERVAIREADITSFLSNKALGEIGQDLKLKDSTMSYQVKKTVQKKDNSLAGATLTVTFKGNFVHDVSAADIQKKAAGKSEADLKTFILSIPGIESANVSLWPIWVRTVPANPQKVVVSID